MIRTNQGGSIISYVLVGVLLLALLGGGIYLVKRQSNEGVVVDDGQSHQEPAEEQSKDNDKPADEDIAKQQAKSEPEVALQDEALAPEVLPETGASDVVPILMVGFMAASVVAYKRSRNPAAFFDL